MTIIAYNLADVARLLERTKDELIVTVVFANGKNREFRGSYERVVKELEEADKEVAGKVLRVSVVRRPGTGDVLPDRCADADSRPGPRP